MIEQSAEIADLATALAKAQGEMVGARKDAANPFFKSKYADLESVWTACRAALTSNGLSVAQPVSSDDIGVIVTTQLMHVSGQWMRSSLRLVPVKSDPQGIGSAISYGRRYTLAAMVGVYQSDDDGEEAAGRGAQAANSNARPLSAPKREPLPDGGIGAQSLVMKLNALTDSKELPGIVTEIGELKLKAGSVEHKALGKAYEEAAARLGAKVAKPVAKVTELNTPQGAA